MNDSVAPRAERAFHAAMWLGGVLLFASAVALVNVTLQLTFPVFAALTGADAIGWMLEPLQTGLVGLLIASGVLTTIGYVGSK